MCPQDYIGTDAVRDQISGGIAKDTDRHNQASIVPTLRIAQIPDRVSFVGACPIVGQPGAIPCWNFDLEAGCGTEAPSNGKGGGETIRTAQGNAANVPGTQPLRRPIEGRD